MSIDITSQIEAARRSLLDLTMRNRLLNFRPNKRRTIRVVDGLPNDVYEMLVINEKAMEFKPEDEDSKDSSDDSLDSQAEFDEAKVVDGVEPMNELTKIWKLPTSEAVSDKSNDRFLKTKLDSETLQKRLFFVSQESHSVFEEQGYSILFLALSFLEWKESPDSEEIRKAPLILVPVELERAGVQKTFRLTWTSEEVFANISLVAKLSDMGVHLPTFQMPEEKTGFEDYLQSVVEAIEQMKGWRVVSDIYLDFFSFTKFVMYKDLDPKSWPAEADLIDHPLLKMVLEPEQHSSDIAGFIPEEVDEKLALKDLYHIMDADPNQIAVLEDIKSGVNLVVEGPPGTGKSQTIANAIAELLGAGKSVLFVSEKMAALEVVKTRLDNVGIGRFCLELHSRKARKKDVLKELERSIGANNSLAPRSNSNLQETEDLRLHLNQYAQALRDPIGKMGLSPYALFQMREASLREFVKSETLLPEIAWDEIENYGNQEWDRAIFALKELTDVAPLVDPINKCPWMGTMPGLVLPGDESKILKSLHGCLEALRESIAQLNKAAEEMGLRKISTPNALTKSLAVGRFIASGPLIEKNVLDNPDWDTPNDVANVLIAKVSECQSKTAIVCQRFKEDSFEENIGGLLSEYQKSLKNHLRIFGPRWWRLIREIRSLYKNHAPWKSAGLIADLSQLVDAIQSRAEVRKQSDGTIPLFGSLWNQEKSQPTSLTKFAIWIVQFRAYLHQELVNDRALDFLSNPHNEKAALTLLDELEKLQAKFITARDDVFARLNIDVGVVFGLGPNFLDGPRLEEHLVLLQKSMHILQKWSQYTIYREKLRETIARAIIAPLESGELEPTDLIACFKFNFADSLLREAFKSRPRLSEFIGELHEKKIARFCELDRLVLRENAYRLLYKLEQQKPLVIGGASRGSEAGILLGEVGRKRGHMPIRRLLAQCGRLVQSIKPCFMMSPLSIAQFLEPLSMKFDVVLFDEASQVRPEDALGSLLRGTQVVVMGDSRQLPPTAFFDSVVAGIEDDEQQTTEAIVSEVESILHQCKRSFPSRTLKWHYRSRHQSLIAVSNREFYENKLLIFPSAVDKSEELGLGFVLMKDTVYDRGRSSVNRKEAREVAKAAVDHYRRYPTKSLGIGAFNIRQQQAILEEIELQLIENREMEEFFRSDRDEHFFVKNLETIQGDERDVIFISVGFGFDENRKLSLNFGPLNQTGGERRLNVLITRAREKCQVFANFRSSDLHTDSDSPYGIRALKSFLSYAEDRTFPEKETKDEDSDSPFEDSVYDFLRDHGYEVKKQVGSASFRIDLAIVDPNSMGSYLAGIECDGQKYHSSPVARDRDRLRQQILEGLGWRIVRIWSTDWYRNKADCQKRLLKALKEISKLQIRVEKIQTPQNYGDRNAVEPEIKDKTHSSGNSEKNQVHLKDLVPKYQLCTELQNIRPSGELHRQSLNKLGILVQEIVDVESPVHKTEVIKRIRSLWGLSRTGERIQNALEAGIRHEVRLGAVAEKSNFLFSKSPKPIIPRRREGNPPADLDLICDEEIVEGIKFVLDHQFSTFPEDLTIQVCRIFGIQAKHDEETTRIEHILARLCAESVLEELPNKMLKLSEPRIGK